VRLIQFAAVPIYILLSFAAPVHAATETNLGKHSKDEIRSACNASGGTLLGVSDSGSYGCESADGKGLVLCNKNSECTGYNQARTQKDLLQVRNKFPRLHAAAPH